MCIYNDYNTTFYQKYYLILCPSIVVIIYFVVMLFYLIIDLCPSNKCYSLNYLINHHSYYLIAFNFLQNTGS